MTSELKSVLLGIESVKFASSTQISESPSHDVANIYLCLPADVGAAEAVHEEVAGEAEELEVVGAGAEDGEPDGPLQVLKMGFESHTLMPPK